MSKDIYDIIKLLDSQKDWVSQLEEKIVYVEDAISTAQQDLIKMQSWINAIESIRMQMEDTIDIMLKEGGLLARELLQEQHRRNEGY